METIPISHLRPFLLYPETRCIRAIVTLIWPYSSSTQSLALLLAEPDFRLRNRRGQVRVLFQGASAAALARTKIGSGDEFMLHLDGVQWIGADPCITTPGRSVDTELLFRRRLVCQITRDGQELASLDVDDDAASERSRSPSPSTPNVPYFAYSTPRFPRLDDGLSTPASSAFHKRARVSGGALVDSPYDPFVRKAGEPERKKARHSWGIEARWTVESDVPSPTKKNRTTDWIQDEDLVSPKKSSQRIIPVGESQSPISEPSPIAARATDSQLDEMRTQYTQDLINQVSGDTEEDSDMEEVLASASAIPDRMGRARSYESPLRQSFSVFRDSTFADPNAEISQGMDFEPELPDLFEPLETVLLQQEENQFFNMPSSDDHEPLDGVQGDATFASRDDRSSSLPQEDIRWLPDESLVREKPDSEPPSRERFERARLERARIEEEELEREIFETTAPISDEVLGSTDEPARGQFNREQEEMEMERREQKGESVAKLPTQVEDNIDPFLQEYTGSTSIMAPPSLPLIQTSNFNSGQVTPMGPPSALPRSPRTPDLLPQQSATLPLPSPFPGDDLATSYMDNASDWQPSAGFTTPLRRSVTSYGFGFGFQSDGLDQRYSTEADMRIADGAATAQVETNTSQIEQEVPHGEHLVNISVPGSLLPDFMLRDGVDLDVTQANPHETYPSEPIPKENAHLEVPHDEPQFTSSPPKAALYSPSINRHMVPELAIPSSSEQISAQALAEMAGAAMDDNEMHDAEMADAHDEMDNDLSQPPRVQYPELPLPEEFYGHSSQDSDQGELVPVRLSPQASELPSSDGVMPHQNLETEGAAYHEDNEEDNDELERPNIYDNEVEEGYSEEEDEEEDESGDEDEEAEDEEDGDDGDDEEGGVRIGAGNRFGPPMGTVPPASAPEIIDLLSDSDESSDEEGSELESVDGDQEDARVAPAALIDDEAEEGSEEDEDDLGEEEDVRVTRATLVDNEAEEGLEEEDEPESEPDDEDEDEMESSEPEDDVDPDQGATTRPLEQSGSQYIQSFDGANDSPHSSFAPALMSDNQLSSSMPALGPPPAANVAPAFIPVVAHDQVPSSTALLPQTRRETVVIDLLSDDDSDDEAMAVSSTAPLPRFKHESTDRAEVGDTYELSHIEDEPMDDYTPRDAMDETMDDQPQYPSEDEHQTTRTTEQQSSYTPVQSPPPQRRPSVTFAPRVSRRRTLGGSQLATQLENQSSQALASSQDDFRRPRLVVQDTFEGMVHSDGSVTTSPPSSRGHGSAETTDNEEDEAPTVQRKALPGYPSHEVAHYDTQPASSPPAPVSDSGYADDNVSYPHLPGTVETQHIFNRPRRPQQSMAESTLATPDASQMTHSQPSFRIAEDESELPPTPRLTQTTSNTSVGNAWRPLEFQQSFDEEMREHEDLSQKLQKLRKAYDRTASTAASLNSGTLQMPEKTQIDSSKASLADLEKIRDDRAYSNAFQGESDEASQRMLDTGFSEPDHASTSPLKPSNIDPWMKPRKPKQRFQPSSPPQPYEDEPTQDSQTLRGDRFDSSAQHDDEDDLPDSQLHKANGKNKNLMKHDIIKSQSVKEEAEDYPSSQLPTNFTFSQTQPSQTKGLLTSITYYTPLSNLMTRVSTQSSQSYSDGTDVIAIVTKSSTKPLRAEKGPKDFGTTFLISDRDLWPQKVLVTVYRPWKRALPVVQSGDVILLRGFDVLPQKKGVGIGLRSGESSAWCVWSFSYKAVDDELFSDPAPGWAKKEKEGGLPGLEEREVMSGPPVQMGEEEREFVRELRDWWVDEAEGDMMKENRGSEY